MSSTRNKEIIAAANELIASLRRDGHAPAMIGAGMLGPALAAIESQHGRERAVQVLLAGLMQIGWAEAIPSATGTRH